MRPVWRGDVPHAFGVALPFVWLQNGLLRLVMGYQFLNTSREGAIEHVRLNRPDLRNALNDVVLDELRRWSESLRSDASVRVAVLAGAGRHFCAGADIDWMRRMGAASESDNMADAQRLSSTFHALDTLPVPLIGRVHGAAIGGGMGLAAICDMVVAADDTQFGFSEVRLGIVPAAISPFVLAKIGGSAARELFLTGSRFSAARALQLGLVHRVVPAAELDEVVAAWAAELMAGAPSAIALAKRLIRTVSGRQYEDVASFTSRAIAEQRMSSEGREGLLAFLEKRPPAWNH
ncbi:MAG: enoyl-CoA hydratase-related protein [Vicinamibacterales bacterium]